MQAITSGQDKLGKTEQRRRLELEGYFEDLRLLEKKVKFYENYTKKLKRLVEQDARKMLKQLREENNRLADGKEAEEEIPGLAPGQYGGIPKYTGPRAPEIQEEYGNQEGGLTEVEEMSNEGPHT